MTDQYSLMLQSISTFIGDYLNREDHDLRSLNSAVYNTALSFSSFETPEREVHNHLKNIMFVGTLTSLIINFKSSIRNYECSFSTGAVLSFPAFRLLKDVKCKTRCGIKEKWISMGGKIYSEKKMIALKSDPIWKQISYFGFPFPPFNYCGCYCVEDVDYDTCVKIGIINDSFDARILRKDKYNDPMNVLKNIEFLNFLLIDMIESSEVKKLT